MSPAGEAALESVRAEQVGQQECWLSRKGGCTVFCQQAKAAKEEQECCLSKKVGYVLSCFGSMQKLQVLINSAASV
jgi:hypothetical protein